ncbi:MAG: hypothetical protein ACJ73L_05030 [Actinomycetes bacterium]
MTLITARTRNTDQDHEADHRGSRLRPLQIVGQVLLVAAMVATAAASSIYFIENFPLWGGQLR